MIELRVEDMTCGHCVSAITRAVKEVDGAARVEVDLRTKRVRIESSRSPGALRDAIAEAGYTPKEA